MTPMPFEGSDGSLASWSETDERWSFKDVSHIEEELRVRDADPDGEGCEKRPEYDLETILRWRRHPRKGYSQYRTKWGGFTIHSNTWEPEQCFDKEAIDDFWKARGGRPEDVPEISSGDETPVLDEDDTDNQKYDDGLMGEDARRRLRLEFRRDKKLFREYRRKKREEQEAEKQRKRRDQVVGSDADDDDDDDDDVPLVSRRRVRPDPVGDASKRKRADEDDDDDDVPLRKRLANNDINETSLSSPTEAPESAVERSRLALAPATFVRPSSAIEDSPAPFYPSPLRSPNPPAAPTAAAQGRFQDSFAQRSEAGPSRTTSAWPSSFPDAGPSTAAPRPQPAAEKPAAPKPAASKPASAASPPAPAVQNPGPAAKSGAQGPKAPSAPTAKPSAAQRRDHRPLSDSSRREIKMLERETKKGGSASTKASGSGTSASSVTKKKSSLPASTSTSATVSGPSTSAQAPVAGPSSPRPPAVRPAAPRPSTSTSVRPLSSAATASAATSTPASFLDAVLPPKSYKGAHKNRSQVKILENAPPEPVGPRTLGHFRARAPAVRPPPSQAAAAAAAAVGSATSGQPSRPGTSLNETGPSHAGPSSSAARDASGRARAADQQSPPHPGSPTLDSPWYPDPPEATLHSRRGSTDMSRSTTGDSLWNEPASSSTSSRGPRRVTIDSSSANVAHADRRRSPPFASGSAGGASPMGSSSYKPVSPTDYRRESASMLPPASPPLSGSNDAALGRARRWGSPQDQRQEQRPTQPQPPAQLRPPQQTQQRRQDTPPQDQQMQQQRPQSPPGPPPLGSPPPPPPPARSISQSQPAPPTVPPSPQPPPPPPSGPSASKDQGGSGSAATISRTPIAPSTSDPFAAGERATPNGDSSNAQAGPSMPVVSAEAPSEDELDEDAAEVDMMTAAASSASPQPPSRHSPPLEEGADFGAESNDNEEALRAQPTANHLAPPSTSLFAHRASTSSRPSTAKGAPPPWLNKASDKPKLTKGTPPPWLARWGPNGTARRAGGSGSGGSGAPNGSGAGEGSGAAANPPAATTT